MNKEKLFSYHSISLFALFILGEGIIVLPLKSADEYTFTGYLFTVLASLLLYTILLPLINCIFDEKRQGFLKKIITLSVCVFSLFCAAETFKEFISFTSKILLPNTKIYISVIIFVLISVYFLVKRQEDILKFNLLSFAFVAIAMIFFLFATLKSFNLRNIFIFSFPSFKTLYNQSMPYFKTFLFPSLLLPVWQALVFKKSRPATAFLGLAVGTVSLGVAILCSVLLFGPTLSGRLDFPYASAISTITVGRLFTRLDGFSYFIYLACALSKITTCLFVVKALLPFSLHRPLKAPKNQQT